MFGPRLIDFHMSDLSGSNFAGVPAQAEQSSMFRSKQRICAAFLIACQIVLFAEAARAQHRLVLRGLKIISNRTVVSFSEDGVKLDNGTTIAWDEIEGGAIGDGEQAEFDRMLKELGDPLYRIRQRLKVGDYEGLLNQAESIYPRYESRRSPTAYMVIQALMWSRLAAGQREAAVEPYLRAYEYLKADPSGGDDLPGDRRLRFDLQTALSPTLVPIWFDAKTAGEVLPGVFRLIKEMQLPRPEGVYIYYATLAAAAGDFDAAQTALRPLASSSGEIAQWRAIAEAQTEVMSSRPGKAVRYLELSLNSFPPQIRPASLYWLGLSQTSSDDPTTRRQGVLQLLHLPALYGTKYPELAGAGLYQSMLALEQLDDPKGSVALRKELLVRYAHTVHAARARSSTD